MTQGPNHWNPPRLASCTCGASHRGTLREINAWFEQHKVDGTEGCDHAIYIESTILDDKERHS